MADTAEDIRENLERQIADLRKEMTRIGKSVSARTSEVLDDAEDAFEDGKGRARKAARQMRDQAHRAADIARENPGTTAVALSTVGLLALGAGLVLGSLLAGGGRR